jgi:hypothetical protein
MFWTDKTVAIVDSWEDGMKKKKCRDFGTKSYHWKVLAETIEEMVDDFEEARREGTVFSPPHWYDANPLYAGTTLREWRNLAKWCRDEEALYAAMAKKAAQ